MHMECGGCDAAFTVVGGPRRRPAKAAALPPHSTGRPRRGSRRGRTRPPTFICHWGPATRKPSCLNHSTFGIRHSAFNIEHWPLTLGHCAAAPPGVVLLIIVVLVIALVAGLGRLRTPLDKDDEY